MTSPSSSSRTKTVRTASPKIRGEGYLLRKENKNQMKVMRTRIATTFSLAPFVERVGNLSDSQKAAIVRAGFGNLLRLPNCSLSKTLIAELIDQWSSEKEAFELAHGTFTLTPLDVSLILGLRIIGKPVILPKGKYPSELGKGILSTPGRKTIPLDILEKKLDRLGQTGNEEVFLRTFLLFTFGTILFPNSGQTVDSGYLSFLTNPDRIKEYAWGLAVRKELLKAITTSKDKGAHYVGGCLFILQIWSYEHFDVARPLRINRLAFPRACQWEKSKVTPRSKVTAEFRNLREDQITWELQPSGIESQVDIIEEFLTAQGDKPQETGPQSGMVNLPMDNDIDAEIDSAIDKMTKAHIFDAPEASSSPTDYPSHREEGDLLQKNWIGEVVMKLHKTMDHISFNPVYKA